MKIVFELDGSAEDLARILQIVQKLASPNVVNPTTRLDNIEVQEEATTNNTATTSTTGPTTVPDFVQNPPVIPKHKRSQKPDPFQLVKQGYVVRGPYKVAENRKEVHLVKPGDSKTRYCYGCEKQQDKPNPFEIVKIGWIVRGPWKEGGKENPYMALHVWSPDKKQHYKYVVGTTKAGTKGLTDDDVKKLKLQAAMAEVQLPPGSDPVPEVTIKQGEEIPSEPLKELAKDNKSSACQICFSRGRPLGKCEKMSAPHCKVCHDEHHGNYLYPFKAL